MVKRFLSFFISSLFFLVIFLSNSSVSNCGLNVFPIHSKYYLSSYYGYRELKTKHFHNGIDIPKPVDTPIYPICSGVISQIGFSSSYGNFLIISYTNGYKSLYGHLSGVYPYKQGSYVNSSDIVGYVGPKYLSNGRLNGFTTGPHLHFTLYYNGKIIDPLSVEYEYIS